MCVCVCAEGDKVIFSSQCLLSLIVDLSAVTGLYFCENPPRNRSPFSVSRSRPALSKLSTAVRAINTTQMTAIAVK